MSFVRFRDDKRAEFDDVRLAQINEYAYTPPQCWTRPVWPAYVFHYTNFSSDRKDTLQRDVAVSDDEAQIIEICQSSIEANQSLSFSEPLSSVRPLIVGS